MDYGEELKQLVLKFVRALKTLLQTQPSAEELAAAHTEAAAAVKELSELKDKDAAAAEAAKFSSEEQAEVDEALVQIAAAQPPPPGNVAVIEAKLEAAADAVTTPPQPS